MKRMKLIGLSLLAIFALGAVAAATAMAEEGFLPTPTGGNVLGKISVLETPGKQNITCGELDKSPIEVINDKHFHVTLLHWLKCKAEGLFPVNSLGAKSEEILVLVLFLVCLDPKNAAKELVAAFGAAGEVSNVHLEVPAVGTLIEVNGTALGSILTTGKTKLFVVDFLGKKGAQTVTECLEGANVKKHNLTSSTNHGTAEAASENVEAGLIQFTTEVELMDS